MGIKKELNKNFGILENYRSKKKDKVFGIVTAIHFSAPQISFLRMKVCKIQAFGTSTNFTRLRQEASVR